MTNLSEEQKKLFGEAAKGGIEEADSLFYSFGLHSLVDDFRNGTASRAKQKLSDLLNGCAQEDPASYKKIYKGTPYCWLGTAAYMLADFESAVFFYDAAATEDLCKQRDPKTEHTAAFNFLTLDNKFPREPSDQIVKYALVRIDELLGNYDPSKIIGAKTKLSVTDLRERLLLPALEDNRREWRSVSMSLLSFFLGWDYRNSFFDLVLEVNTVEPLLIHIFKGCLLFESLLKEKLPRQTKLTQNSPLGDMLKDLDMQNSLGLTSVPARKWPPSEMDFGKIIASPSLQQYINGDPVQVENTIELTYQTRNSLAHRIGWNVPITKQQYQCHCRIIAVSCLHAIASLY